jgi:hypothetical protein
MSHLVPYDSPHGSKVDCIISILVEEGVLQNRSGEDDLVEVRMVIRLEK